MTLDFNHRPKFHEQVGELIDDALAQERDAQTPRDYLGASRLGVACERALQYEYTRTPVDPGREFSGRLLRIFEVGHLLEELAIRCTPAKRRVASLAFLSHAAASRGMSTAFSMLVRHQSRWGTRHFGSARP